MSNTAFSGIKKQELNHWDTAKSNGRLWGHLDVSRAKYTLMEGFKKTMQWVFSNRENLRQVSF
jgi:hypothetical protein